MIKHFNLYVYISLLISFCNTARILVVIPTPSISHQVVFRPLTQELAKRGHEVVVITTDPAFPQGEAPANLIEIDLHDLSYKIWAESFYLYVTGKKDVIITQLEILYKTIDLIFEEQLKVKEVQRLITENKHFDLLILEAWVKPALVLSHIFKAPVIQMSSFGRVLFNYEDMGAPTHPMLNPRISRQRIYNLTLLEKMSEMYNELLHLKLAFCDVRKAYDEWLRKNFGPDVPSMDELSNNIEMMFINMYPIWEGNIPVPPSVIHIGGIHRMPEKSLPKDLKSFLDSSKNGVIYFSFGTNTLPSNLPAEKIQMFMRVFAQLPYDVLWKWDKEELPGMSKNIRISKWFPQSDLLRHPKVKLFITQGGLQSTDESILAEVPLIGIPVLGDQWYNTEKYVFHKIGLKLELESLSEQEFKTAINTVIEDESYRENVKRLRTLMEDQPQSGLDRAVWWTEYVLRHGGAKHLRAPAANISWTEYYEIELLAVVLSAILIALTISVFAMYCVLKSVTRSIKSKSD